MSIQRGFGSIVGLSIILLGLGVANASGVRHVAGNVPVLGKSRELSAERQAETNIAPPVQSDATSTHNWKLLATIPGAVIHDIAFPTASVGYAAAELGQVWKTMDGGKTWTEIMNLGFPYYWYGVAALSTNDIVVSGFDDKNFEGIIRWSHDGGTTWTGDIVLTTTGWSDRIRFANNNDGLVIDQLSTGKGQPNMAHYSTNGGAKAKNWKSVVPDPNGGWFGNQFSLLSNLHARMSGITYCASENGGAQWSCRKSIDSVFDGPTFFLNDTVGWVGGGEISPSVAGWVHRTTNGGRTWSGRVLNSPWPIREIWFLTPMVGWAAGGNYSQNIGGMYFSGNGGKTWSLDFSTGAEMGSCASQLVSGTSQVWCAGYDGSFDGKIYSLHIKAD